jgi:type II secretory pathway component GspD/PulD (secretin)
MNCDTYLSMLATLPVDELGYGDARAHAADCRDCDRVTRVVAERERNMILAFDEVRARATAGSIATRALVMSRRRRIAFYYRVGLSIATAATLLFFIVSRRTAAARLNETFRLQCLSSDQAAEVLRPMMSPDVSLLIPPNSTIGIIRVGASPAEMAQVRSLLERYDSPAQSQCGLQLAVPKAIQLP